MQYPNDLNGDVFRRMEAHGFDFKVPHDVEFFAIFPTEELADEVATLYLEEHRAGETMKKIRTKPGRDGGMELVLVKPMLVTYENVDRFESELGNRVAARGGYLDGWGVLQEPGP
jgi:hypothetical protein